MTINLSKVDYTTDNFIDWLSKLNNVIDELAARIVTVESNTTVGTASITGAVATNTIYASDIFGGQINVPDTITVRTPAAFANTVNVTGAVRLSNTFYSTGAVTLANTLNVTGNTVLSNFTANNGNISNSVINSLTLTTVRSPGSNINVTSNIASTESIYAAKDIQANTARILDNITVPFVNTQRVSGTGPGTEVLHNANSNFTENVRIDKQLTVGNTRFNGITNLDVEIPGRTLKMSNTQVIYGEQTGATTSPFLIFSVPKTQIRSAKLQLHATSNTVNSTTAWEALIVHSNNAVAMTEYAIVTVGNTQTGALTVNTSASDVRVFFAPVSTNNSVGYSVHTIS